MVAIFLCKHYGTVPRVLQEGSAYGIFLCIALLKGDRAWAIYAFAQSPAALASKALPLGSQKGLPIFRWGRRCGWVSLLLPLLSAQLPEG